MQVRFIKETPERYRLECVRSDGSKTAASLEFRSYFKHDLLHLVVERAANLQDSFFGMVKSGKDLAELSSKAIRESAPVLSIDIIGFNQGERSSTNRSPELVSERRREGCANHTRSPLHNQKCPLW